MRALVAPNKQCRYFPGGPKNALTLRSGQRRRHEKFDVAWAGGSWADFFILLSRNGFGATTRCGVRSLTSRARTSP